MVTVIFVYPVLDLDNLQKHFNLPFQHHAYHAGFESKLTSLSPNDNTGLPGVDPRGAQGACAQVFVQEQPSHS